MSKAFDFAGGRLGYFVAAPAFVQAVMLVRLPYHLSRLSQAAAIVALRHSEDTLATVAKLASERDRVVAGLEKLGYSIVPPRRTLCSSVISPTPPQRGRRFWGRGCSSAMWACRGYLRATVGLPEENDALLAAAAKVAPIHMKK